MVFGISSQTGRIGAPISCGLVRARDRTPCLMQLVPAQHRLQPRIQRLPTSIARPSQTQCHKAFSRTHVPTACGWLQRRFVALKCSAEDLHQLSASDLQRIPVTFSEVAEANTFKSLGPGCYTAPLDKPVSKQGHHHLTLASEAVNPVRGRLSSDEIAVERRRKPVPPRALLKSGRHLVRQADLVDISVSGD